MKTIKKSIVLLTISAILACFGVLLTGCGEPTTGDTGDTGDAKGFISGSDLSAAFTDIDAYKGYDTAYYGQVFKIENDGTNTYFQIWQDYTNLNNNTIVVFPGKPGISENDYVYVEGRILGKCEGENLFGDKVTAMKINATKVEKMSYMDVVVPTRLSVEVNQTITQKKYSLTVEKVEFADTETRIYVKAINDGKSNFNIYTYSAKVKQGKKQYEQKDNFDADYKSLPSELMKDAEDDGIILFPALERKDFTLIMEGSSDDWDENLKPFKFNVKVAE